MNLLSSLNPDEKILWNATQKQPSNTTKIKKFTNSSCCCSMMIIFFLFIFTDMSPLLFIILFAMCATEPIIMSIIRRKISKDSNQRIDEYFITNKRIGITNNGEVNTILELDQVNIIEITQALAKVFVKFYLKTNDKIPMLEYKFVKNPMEVDNLVSTLHSLIPLTQEYLEGGVRFVKKEG